MKRTITIIAAGLIILVGLFGIFILWGSSKTVSDEVYTNGIIIDGPGTPEKGKRTYSIMTYNVGYASGMANSMPDVPGKDFFDKNLQTMIEMIAAHNPDILCVQEIDIESKRSLHVDQVGQINQKIGYVDAAFAPNFSKNYVPFPYWPPSAHWGRVYSGQAVFSTLPLKDQKIMHLDPPEIYSWIYNLFYIGRAIQRTHVTINGQKVYIFNVHLEAWDGDTREKQARRLLELYSEVKDHPVIIAGDFNVTPSYATRKHDFPDDSYGIVDYRGEKTIEIILSENTLSTAISRKRYLSNEHKFMTYTSVNPHMKIDYIFYNNRIKPVRSYVIEKKVEASDHRPLFMEFFVR